jgi:methyltransferase (TIGR00027 family)
MRPGHASRTAEQNALLRYLERSVPSEQRLFTDPAARSFLGGPLAVVGRIASVPPFGALTRWIIDRRWPGVRTSVVARTRLIDDALEAEVVEGRAAQVIILGAGYDTRAMRLACLRQIPVFEVDHPDTQAAKRRALDRIPPDGRLAVRFIASDFNLEELGPAMVRAGFDESARTALIWEGVSNYLGEEAVDATLRWCARAATGSLLIFTYVNRDVLTDPGRYVGAHRLHATLANADERLTFGLDPARTREFLAERGLVLERDLGAAEYRRLQYGDRATTMRGHEFYRIAFARVAVG